MAADPALARRLLAEFAVIVLGVIVALGADRWIQALDQQGMEMDYLARLEAELVGDSTRLAERLEASRASSASTRQLLLWIEGEPVPDSIDAERWVRELVTTSWYAAFEPRRATWNELLATGNLRVISDPPAREALGEWDETVDFVITVEQDWKSLVGKFVGALGTGLPVLVHIEALRSFGSGQTGVAPMETRLMQGVDLPKATPADLERMVAYFRNDADALAALTQTHIVHWARGSVYGPRGAVPTALGGALEAVRAARADLR